MVTRGQMVQDDRWYKRTDGNKRTDGTSSSSSSAFPSYTSGVHHFWVRFLCM